MHIALLLIAYDSTRQMLLEEAGRIRMLWRGLVSLKFKSQCRSLGSWDNDRPSVVENCLPLEGNGMWGPKVCQEILCMTWELSNP